LDGFELPAAAWESDVLSSRVAEYDPMLLDTLCMMGRVAWGRTGGRTDGRTVGQADGRTGGRTTGPIRSTPIALFLREHTADWIADKNGGDYELSSYAAAVREVLEQRGASFFHELVAMSGLLPTQVEQALGELAGLGLVTSDSFAGLRALITPSSKRKPLSGAARRYRTAPVGIETAGRWSLLGGGTGGQADGRTGARQTELAAKTYLRRYGVVFKRLLARETGAPPWRDLLMVYRRMEARGEIRGGRFVSGMSGEQFALAEAVGQLRAIRRIEAGGRLIAVGAADPLNLTGIITPGERVVGVIRNRILYRDGVPVLALEAGEAKPIGTEEPPTPDMIQALVRKSMSPALRARLAMSGVSAASVPMGRRPGRRRKRSDKVSGP
jgi:ATP-dependent helicase Lhr and Lhr-like helicase